MERATRPGRPAGHTTISRQSPRSSEHGSGHLSVLRSLAVYLAALSTRRPGRGSFPLPSRLRSDTPMFPCSLTFENALQHAAEETILSFYLLFIPGTGAGNMRPSEPRRGWLRARAMGRRGWPDDHSSSWRREPGCRGRERATPGAGSAVSGVPSSLARSLPRGADGKPGACGFVNRPRSGSSLLQVIESSL